MTRTLKTLGFALATVLGVAANASADPPFGRGGSPFGPRGGFNYYPGLPYYAPGFVYPGGTRFSTLGIGGSISIGIGSRPSYFPYTNDYGRYSGLDSTLYFGSLNRQPIIISTPSYIPPVYYPVRPITPIAPRVLSPIEPLPPLATPDTTLPAPRHDDAANPKAAVLNITVPVTDAEVLIDGYATHQRGLSREFISPTLDPGSDYSYEVTARWTEDGKPVERTRVVPVRAGQRVPVDLRKP